MGLLQPHDPMPVMTSPSPSPGDDPRPRRSRFQLPRGDHCIGVAIWSRDVRQARAPRTQPFGAEAFEARDGTVLRWLGMAGFLINSRGTTLMLDPLLGGFDMPVMIEFPIAAADGEVGCCPGQAQRQRPLQRPDLS